MNKYCRSSKALPLVKILVKTEWTQELQGSLRCISLIRNLGSDVWFAMPKQIYITHLNMIKKY
jgi:hypothetical protein